MACSREGPHISLLGCNPPQTAGRSGRSNSSQASAGVRCAHRSPARLPWGIFGMGVEMDGAMQQAPQPGRHCMGAGSGGQALGGPQHLLDHAAHLFALRRVDQVA